MTSRFPIYIVSKGRWESRLTSKALEWMKVPYYVVVEEQEYAQYAAVIAKKKLLVLDKKYQAEYDTCDVLGDRKCKGPGPARNFAWEHSMSGGHTWHWVMDDNIAPFYRLVNNAKIPVRSGAIFSAAEDFVLRYENVAVSGFHYDFFAKSKQKIPPVYLNTRVYSCLLIRNDIPYRWRGRYNEDTDLSLRVLKDGWCTALFLCFLAGKARTQTMRGCNTDELYARGTLAKSQMLVALHPDVSRLVWKFGRWHHHVDYRQFQKNQLRFRQGFAPPDGANEYGLRLVTTAV